MPTTRNGWSTAPKARTVVSAPGCADTGEVRAGDVATVLQALALAFDAEVEPLTEINGYRSPELNDAARGAPDSNHLSGTALDLNGSRHPYEPKLPAKQRGKAYRHGFTDKQVTKIRQILARFDGAVRWGLDFNDGYRDAMHFEIHGTPAQVAAVAARLRGTPTTQEDDLMTSADDILAAIYDLRDTYLRVPNQPYGYPAAVNNKIDALPNAVLGAQITGVDGEPGALGERIAWIDKRLRDLTAQNAGLLDAINALATGHGADPEAIAAAAEAGARKALESARFTVHDSDT